MTPIRSLQPFTVGVIVLIVAYIGLNIVQPGGSQFIYLINAHIVIPFSIATVILAIALWRELRPGSQERWLWGGLTLGWSLWSIAETYWGINTLLKTEVHFPSWADALWLSGYIPMYIVLWTRLRSLPRPPYHRLRQVFWLIMGMIAFIWTMIAIMMPTLEQSRTVSRVEQFLIVVYPLANLINLTLVLRFLIVHQGGKYEQVWMWVILGFLLSSIGDLIFNYAYTAGLYYPDGQANLLSTLGVDVPYNLSYLVWCLALLEARSLRRSYQPETSTPGLTAVPNTHLLVFTKGDDTVIEVSTNFFRIFPLKPVEGQRLADLLGISADEEATLLNELKASGFLKERAVSVNIRSGKSPAYLSGVRVLNPQGEYAGATFALRMLTQDYQADQALSQEQKGVLQFVLQITGAQHSEQQSIKRLLADYYVLLLQTFYNHLHAEFGMSVIEAFLAEVQQVAEQNQLSLTFPNVALQETKTLSLAEFRQALHRVFQAARNFMNRLTDESTVNQLFDLARSKISDSKWENIRYFEAVEER